MEATVVGSFTDLGVAARRRLPGWEEPRDGALTGKVAVVTGATSGIGQALARQLVELGATVHLVGRDAKKLDSTVAALRNGRPARSVAGHRADLARLADVRRLAATVHHAERPIDVLAHVAGALVHERQHTTDGIELTAQVHVVAPFLLTTLVLDSLAVDARVITMTSGGMYTQRLDVNALFDPPEPFNGTVAYAQAKRAQVELNGEWARRYPDRRIGFHVVHPGWADTPGVQTALPGFARVMGSRLRTADEGADTAAWLAWSEAVTPPGGELWHDRRRRRTVVLPWTATDDADRNRLWNEVADRAGT